MALSSRLSTRLSNVVSANEGGSGQLTFQQIFGSLLVEGFDAAVGVAGSGVANQWVGFVQATTLPPVGTSPVYAPDGTRFGGKPVVQCAVAGSLALRATGLATLLATGTRPWTYTVGRARNAAPGAFATLTDAGVSAVSDECALRINSSNQFEAFTSGVGSAVGPAADAARHSFQQYLDGTNLNFAIDNTVVGTFAAPGVSIFHNVTAIGVGCDASAAIHFCDASIALFLLLSAKPTNAQIVAADALAMSMYPP